jgi:hypothetical protein
LLRCRFGSATAALPLPVAQLAFRARADYMHNA